MISVRLIAAIHMMLSASVAFAGSNVCGGIFEDLAKATAICTADATAAGRTCVTASASYASVCSTHATPIGGRYWCDAWGDVCKYYFAYPTCPSPKVPNPTTGICEDPPQKDCNETKGDYSGQMITRPYSSTTPSKLCIESCEYPVNSTVCLPSQNTCGLFIGTGSGTNCTVSDATDAAVKEESSEEACLSQGKGYITINGVTTCASPTPDAPVSTTSTSSSTTTGSTSGTTTTTTTTTDYGAYAQTSTTSTVTDASGTSTTTSQSTDPKQPASSVSGGYECNVPPACSGDAIQCAILTKEWQQWCQTRTISDHNDFVDIYQDATADVGQVNPIATEKPMGDFFNLTNHVSVGASCPSSMTIPLIGGRTYTLDLSYLCQYLGLIALILKSLAWLFVGRMTLEAL